MLTIYWFHNFLTFKESFTFTRIIETKEFLSLKLWMLKMHMKINCGL
jgi:hypothetical protein